MIRCCPVCSWPCPAYMGAWVPFCERHWFALSSAERFELFNKFQIARKS